MAGLLNGLLEVDKDELVGGSFFMEEKLEDTLPDYAMVCVCVREEKRRREVFDISTMCK